jgi:hypothetical protein
MNILQHIPSHSTLNECCTGTGENECFIEAKASTRNINEIDSQKELVPIRVPLEEIEKELEKLHIQDLRSLRYDMYSLDDLRKTTFSNDMLLEPFLPRIGIGAVVGMPDSGKSMLCRQLALTIAFGKRNFMGFTLAPKHKRAIFVTTEDTLEATKACFTRQSDTFKTIIRPEFEKNLLVLLADDMTTDEILARLEQLLINNAADLVVIDAYGDVFKGGEGNSNIANRNSLRPFSILSKNFETLILFVHHTNKGAKYAVPDHIHVQGGSGFVQKVRTVLELRNQRSDGCTKYLACTKGNGVSQEEKRNAIELTFDENTFMYTTTGKRIPLEELRTEKNDSYKLRIDAKEIFFPYEMTLKRREIIERAIKKYEVSERSIDQWVSDNLQSAGYGIYKNPDFVLTDASLAVPGLASLQEPIQNV